MSDRKYRQRGYDDDPRDRQPKPASPRPAPEPGAPAGARRISQDGPRNLNMPGFREVVRCSQCASFDPGSRFECMQTVTARVTPKNAKNSCSLYAPRTKVERETTTPRTDDARKAFDDLFKF